MAASVSCSLKKVSVKGRQDSEYKKKYSKTWSEEAIDTLINWFQSHKCLWNVTGGDYKDQNSFGFRKI